VKDWNFKELTSFTGRCEERDLIYEINFEEFFDGGKERTLSNKGDLTLCALDETECEKVAAEK
jgi:hypothetical protein